MKRIAYLVNQYPAISHTFVRREIRALEREGFEIRRFTIRTTRETLIDPEDLDEFSRTRRVLDPRRCLLGLLERAVRHPLRFCRATRTAWKAWRHSGKGFAKHAAYLAEAAHLAMVLEREQVEHLHAHFGTNPATIALLAHELGGPPYSFTVHGPDEFDRPDQELLGQKIRESRFVVGISSFGRSQLQRWCDVEHWPRIEVVHCGLSEDFLQRPLTPVPATRQLICLGRLSPQKGHFLLLEAIRRLAPHVPPFRVVLIGDGELREGLQREARRHGIESYLHFAGWQTQAQIQEWLEASRCLVLPSSAEGLPVAIMESLALGRPVLTTYVAGIPELVLPGENGWLIPAGDADQLAQAMQAALDATPEQLARMGEAGKRRVQERHNIRTEAAKLARILRGDRDTPTSPKAKSLDTSSSDASSALRAQVVEEHAAAS